MSSRSSAAGSGACRSALGLLDDHAHLCVSGGPEELKAERTDELMSAVGRLMRRRSRASAAAAADVGKQPRSTLPA